jgi:hypothetical protein
MKTLIVNKLVSLTQKRIETLKSQKKALIDSVAQEIPDVVELEKKENIWSVSTNGGAPSNMLHIKDERELLVSVGIPRGRDGRGVAITKITDGKDGQAWQFGPTRVDRGAVSVFGGVTMRNYKKLQKITKKIRFWEAVSVRLLSL